MGNSVYRIVEAKVYDFKLAVSKLSDIDVEKKGIKEGDFVKTYCEREGMAWIYTCDGFKHIELSEVTTFWHPIVTYYPINPLMCYDDGEVSKVNCIREDNIETQRKIIHSNTGGYIRDRFLSSLWGDKYNLIERGLPSDMSPISKKAVAGYDDGFIFGKTYVRLDEWENLFYSLLEKYKNDIVKLRLEKYNIEERFNYLVNLIKHCSNKYNSNDYSLEKKYDEESEDYPYAEQDLDDDFQALMDIQNEINVASKMVRNQFGYLDYEYIRIIYFIG